MEFTTEICQFIDHHTDEAKSLLMELSQIPAPSNHEEARAAFCAQWLKNQGAENVIVDDALNVIYPIGCAENNPIAVFMAHSDVVFPDTTPLPLRISENKLFCPGVGDDTANVVALLMTAKFIAQKNLQPKDTGILLVVNSGEEGLGNLKGCRKIIETYGNRISEFITFDGYSNSIVNKAVGSRRYRVEIDTEGGHSYSKFGNKNAIACLSSLVSKLYSIQVPTIGKTTYNVGTISGGTSVNTIAQHAEMLFEFRSDEREALEIMEQNFQCIIQEMHDTDLRITVTLVGDRPCGGNVDKERENTLMERGAAAVMDHYGYPVTFHSGSTDCNMPLSYGIPSVCVGCIEGDGAHTREEYITIDSQRPGLGVAFQLILHHF